MYGVIVCPRCKRAKGVDLKQKTTTCACGFEIRVTPARIRARAASARDLAPLVGRVNADLAGGAKEVQRMSSPPRRPRPREVHARIIAAIPNHGDRTTRVRAAAVELTNELELFTREDWTQVLEGLGVGDAEGALAALVGANMVFEPKPGFFRAVELRP